MNPINIEEIITQLGEFAKSYQRPLRGKAAVLSPLRDELLQLDTKGMTSGEIAAKLAEFHVTVSKDTVGKFLRIEKQNDRKKTVPPTARKVMMPRNLASGDKP